MGWLLLLVVLAMSGPDRGRARRGRAARRPRGPQVEAVRGPWAAIVDAGERLETYARDLAEAYRAAGLPEVAVPLAVAHSMLATGAWMRGGPRVWNNNVGVIRAGPSWAGPWAALATREVTDDRGTVDPSDDVVEVQLGQAWRSYGSLAEGTAAAVRLWRGARFRPAYELLVAGDPAWSSRLGELGYYTANPRHFEIVYRNRLDRVRALLG